MKSHPPTATADQIVLFPPGPDLDIPQTARVLGTTTATVKQLLADGILEAYQLTPKVFRVRRETIIRLRNREVPPLKFAGRDK